MESKRLKTLAARFRSEAEDDITVGLVATADPMQEYLDAIAEASGANRDSQIAEQTSAGNRIPNVVAPYSVITGRLIQRRNDRGIGVDRLEDDMMAIRSRRTA